MSGRVDTDPLPQGDLAALGAAALPFAYGRAGLVEGCFGRGLAAVLGKFFDFCFPVGSRKRACHEPMQSRRGRRSPCSSAEYSSMHRLQPQLLLGICRGLFSALRAPCLIACPLLRWVGTRGSTETGVCVAEGARKDDDALGGIEGCWLTLRRKSNADAHRKPPVRPWARVAMRKSHHRGAVAEKAPQRKRRIRCLAIYSAVALTAGIAILGLALWAAPSETTTAPMPPSTPPAPTAPAYSGSHGRRRTVMTQAQRSPPARPGPPPRQRPPPHPHLPPGPNPAPQLHPHRQA